MKILEAEDRLAKHFMAHKVQWIEAEKPFHESGRQVVALAEKSGADWMDLCGCVQECAEADFV
jgi:hypothetical protein